MKNLLVVGLFVIAGSSAFAGANLVINANSPSRVSLDGAEVGQTPTTLAEVAPGFHEVSVQSLATSEVRVYDVYSPASVTIQKDIQIQFEGVAPQAVAGDAPGVNPDVKAAAAAERARQNERNKVRTRNTLLGAAVANEVFNRGSSKKVVRGVSLGGALLNELIKR